MPSGTVILPFSLTEILSPKLLVSNIALFNVDSLAQPTAVRLPLPSTVMPPLTLTATPSKDAVVAFAFSTPSLCISSEFVFTVPVAFTIPPFRIIDPPRERAILLVERFSAFSTPSPLIVIVPSQLTSFVFTALRTYVSLSPVFVCTIVLLPFSTISVPSGTVTTLILSVVA